LTRRTRGRSDPRLSEVRLAYHQISTCSASNSASSRTSSHSRRPEAARAAVSGYRSAVRRSQQRRRTWHCVLEGVPGLAVPVGCVHHGAAEVLGVLDGSV